jgi:hypothetical protein
MLPLDWTYLPLLLLLLRWLLLQIASACDKVYGVSQNNRVSAIDVITKADALAFLQAEEEQQARQQQQQQAAPQQPQAGNKRRAVAAS